MNCFSRLLHPRQIFSKLIQMSTTRSTKGYSNCFVFILKFTSDSLFPAFVSSLIFFQINSKNNHPLNKRILKLFCIHPQTHIGLTFSSFCFFIKFFPNKFKKQSPAQQKDTQTVLHSSSNSHRTHFFQLLFLH